MAEKQPFAAGTSHGGDVTKEEPYERQSSNSRDGAAKRTSNRSPEDQSNLFSVIRRTIAAILFPDPKSSPPLMYRIRSSLVENETELREASINFGREMLLWTRRGTPLRGLLVITVGTITLITTTGCLIFTLFFLAATVNAIIISILISLAAAGGFLALFFTFMTAIYIGALSVASFALSTATVSTLIVVVIASGWIGFLWAVWLTAKRSLHVTKKSLSGTGSVISAYSVAPHPHREISISAD